jgi:DtxR family Mn-dependent transcriptional regulator
MFMPPHTAAVQDYVKALYLLESEGEPEAVPTSALATRLGVTAASATNMLKKLGSLGLVDHVPYAGASLTQSGTKVALEMIRHHRLLETYLAEALGVPWDEVHKEAEVLEHVLSEELEERISARLGHPKADPHGHPIPAKDGSLPVESRSRLWDAPDGGEVEVERVSDQKSEVLRYLEQVGIKPGATVEVVERGPLEGPLYVRVRSKPDEVHALSKELSEAVWVL